jgi:phosphatidylglycerol:prolipoprotein diacylglycerol transferase
VLLGLLRSGGVFYGGLLGALPVAAWCVKRYALPFWRTADVLAPSVILGQAIGRWGCFFAGCCYGRETNVSWAVTFRDSYAMREIGTKIDTPLHPTQIYESLACFLILGILLWMAPRKRFHGQVVLAYVTLYAVARFVIERFRGDAIRGFVLGGRLSTSQAIAIAMIVAVALVLPYLVRRKRVAPAAA